MSLEALRASATGLSLLVSVTLVAFYLRSYRVGDSLALTWNAHVAGSTHSRVVSLTTGPGQLLLGVTHTQAPAGAGLRIPGVIDEETPGFHYKWSLQPLGSLINLGWDRTFLSRRGFLAASRASHLGPVATARTYVAAPFWFLILPFAVPPALYSLRRYRRGVRRCRGLCPHCGYDVRTTPALCPECGRSPQPPSPASPLRTWAGRIALAAACVIIATAATLGGRSADLPVAVEVRSFVHDLPARTTPPSPATPTTDSPAPRAAHAPSPPVGHTMSRSPEVVFITPRHRELARQVDPARTYVFLPGNKAGRADQLRHQIACVQMFAYHKGRWHMHIAYVRVGQSVGTPEYPSDLRAQALKDTGDDLCVTLVDAAGNATVRSSNADGTDPVRRFLVEMTSYSGQALARELFPPP